MEDYSCSKCGNLYLYMKKYGVPYPDEIIEDCEACGEKQIVHKRYWANHSPIISVGGHDGITYHPAPLAPNKKTAGKEYRKTYDILKEQY